MPPSSDASDARRATSTDGHGFGTTKVVPELPPDVIEAIHANRKIEAIKRLRLHRDLGLKEAKDVVDAYAAQHPHRIVDHRPREESGLGRLVLVALVIAASYAAYRFLAQ